VSPCCNPYSKVLFRGFDPLILSKPHILSYLRAGTLKIDPPIPEDRVAQVSIDLSLGRKLTTFKAPEYLSAIHIVPSLWQAKDLWIEEERDTFKLQPRQFVLAQTYERVRIPPDLVGFVEGRSSWARVGITIHVTAPKIDPGFEGPITLELANLGNVPVELRAEIDLPAQLMLMQVSAELEKGDLYAGTFQYQTDPVPRKRQ
jgi:dCTP deaminase